MAEPIEIIEYRKSPYSQRGYYRAEGDNAVILAKLLDLKFDPADESSLDDDGKPMLPLGHWPGDHYSVEAAIGLAVLAGHAVTIVR